MVNDLHLLGLLSEFWLTDVTEELEWISCLLRVILVRNSCMVGCFWVAMFVVTVGKVNPLAFFWVLLVIDILGIFNLTSALTIRSLRFLGLLYPTIRLFSNSGCVVVVFPMKSQLFWTISLRVSWSG